MGTLQFLDTPRTHQATENMIDERTWSHVETMMMVSLGIRFELTQTPEQASIEMASIKQFYLDFSAVPTVGLLILHIQTKMASGTGKKPETQASLENMTRLQNGG